MHDKCSTFYVLASYDYTVRADGQRTAFEETHWFDADSDAVVELRRAENNLPTIGARLQ